MTPHRFSTIAAIVAIALIPALASAAPCAPSADDQAAAAKAYAAHDQEMQRLLPSLAGAKGEAALEALSGMLRATRAMQGVSTSYSKEYCMRAQKVIDAAFETLSTKFQGDERTQYLLRTQSIAKNYGVTLSQAQNAMINDAVKPAVEKAIKDLESAVAKKDMNAIENAHGTLEAYANTDIGKSLGVAEKMKAAEEAYRALESAERKAPDATKLLADARTALSAGNYRDAVRALQYAENTVEKPTAEMVALRKELSDKWLAAEFAKLDQAMAAVKASATEQSVMDAARALRSACGTAQRLEVNHARCQVR